MREIKFKGKRIDNKKWVYGNLISNIFFYHNPKRSCYYILQNENDNDNWEDIVSDLDDYEISTESICQYTGLKDKNGVEIFEGDLLDCVDRIVEVYWNEKCGTWDSRFIKYTDIEQMSNGIQVVNWKYRASVIGNIHEVKP